MTMATTRRGLREQAIEDSRAEDKQLEREGRDPYGRPLATGYSTKEQRPYATKTPGTLASRW